MELEKGGTVPKGEKAGWEKAVGMPKECPKCGIFIHQKRNPCPNCLHAFPKGKGRGKKAKGKRGRPAGNSSSNGASFPFGANAKGKTSGNPFDAALSFIEAAGGLEAAKETIDRLAALSK